MPNVKRTYQCQHCGDVFTTDDLDEFMEMGEQFYVEPFICPDCTAELQRMDADDQFINLMNA